MPDDSHPSPAPTPSPRPSSPRQLAARRANLQLANAVAKRIRYRPTDRRRAANLRNLARANAVPRARRYRMTPERLAANRANLLKARMLRAYPETRRGRWHYFPPALRNGDGAPGVVVLVECSMALPISLPAPPRDGNREPSSLDIAEVIRTSAAQSGCRVEVPRPEVPRTRAVPRVPRRRRNGHGKARRLARRKKPPQPRLLKHGLSCRSIRSSLAAAGETREDFQAHLERCRRAFRPRSPEERRIVRAIAEVLWRRLRAFRSFARWQAHRLLGKLASLDPADLVFLSLARDPSDPDQEVEKASEVAEGLEDDLRLLFASEDSLEPSLKRLRGRLGRLLRALDRVRRGEPARLRPYPPRCVSPDTVSKREVNRLMKSPIIRKVEKMLGIEWEPPAAPARRRKPVPRLRSLAELPPALERELTRLLAPRSGPERQVVAAVAESLALRLAVYTRRARREASDVREVLEAAARPKTAASQAPEGSEGGQADEGEAPSLGEQLTEALDDYSGALADAFLFARQSEFLLGDYRRLRAAPASEAPFEIQWPPEPDLLAELRAELTRAPLAPVDPNPGARRGSRSEFGPRDGGYPGLPECEGKRSRG